VSSASYTNNLATAVGDNVSLFDLNTWLPTYYEVSVSVKVGFGGAGQNSYVIFDFQDANNFKYAGVDVLNNQLVIGQRSAAGWTNLATLSVKGLGVNKQTSFMLAANYMTATVTWNGTSVAYTFATPLNTGMLGLGTNGSLTNFTGYTVQRLPVNYTYSVLEDFSDGVANKFVPQTGTWTATTGTTGRYSAVPPATDAAFSTRPLAVAPLSYVEFSATVNASKAGASAGLVFNYTSSNDFLYAAVIAGTNQVVVGHRSNGTWYVDATASTTITAGTDYTLLVAMTEGTTNGVNVVLNGKSVLSFNYNYLVHDGGVGLFGRNGNASFDNVLLRGDDIAFAGGGSPLTAAVAPAQPAGAVATIDAAAVNTALTEAERRWVASGLVTEQAITSLGAIQIQIADLQGLTLGLADEAANEIVIDANAGGYGWFIDPTLNTDHEFAVAVNADEREATEGSAAFGKMDLLTVVEHELGHLLGYQHGSSDIMNETLSAGIRITPFDPSINTNGVLPVFGYMPGAGTAAPPATTGETPVIRWASHQDALMGLLADTGEAQRPDWLDNFLNNSRQVGKPQTPNAGLRVRG
jgi:hypothetical protein